MRCLDVITICYCCCCCDSCYSCFSCYSLLLLRQIPPGASTVMIQELGPECRGGCNVVVTLAVARPQGVPAGNTASPTGDARNAAGRPNWVVDGTGAADTSSSDSDTAPAATPRGLADSGPAAQSTSAAPDQPRASAPLVGGGYMPVAPNGAPVVRTFNRLWPFRVRVNMPPGTAQMIRSSVFGNPSGNSAKRRSNTINNRLRLTRTRNERGSAAAAAAAALPTIPRSKLYDPYAPVTVSAEVELQMADADSLQVDVAVRGQAKDAGGVAVLAPQSRQGSISVSVRDASGAPVPSAEVTIVVVDKAVLDLMPYALQVRFIRANVCTRTGRCVLMYIAAAARGALLRLCGQPLIVKRGVLADGQLTEERAGMGIVSPRLTTHFMVEPSLTLMRGGAC